MDVEIGFKSGATLKVKCDKFTLKKDVYGDVTAYRFEGLEDKKPVYIDFSCVEYVVTNM